MWSILQAAGWPIWPLVVCSFVALALIIERAYTLRPPRILPGALLVDLRHIDARHLPGPNVVAKLASSSLLGSVLAASLRALHENLHLSEAALRERVEREGRRAVRELERYLTTLGSIATAAPLLGLLGTVIGMIEIFGSQAPGTGNPAQLAHGISIALYNTAFGLIVAIPSLLAHRHFRARVEDFELELEAACERFVQQVNQWGAHGRGIAPSPEPSAPTGDFQHTEIAA
ncbi:MotA/TolQ/ExbB proton channel family protein [Inhella gelatinilytica]|uniref:MotA/TolQ/ExbB proton channel family protein n=1 Tax=Inhella gelatinilytica TaxID=2795030 RepID=A0A931IWH0_9BURK|nr:MotA/TolQ/ExbB proton channel family protein [Inhella gelatinilytica]MBH9554092.1 MotA/TolQ/ExbB proton channel family protein [Inhella gelatinilytica]